jgi:hypothetical protein
MSYCLGVEIGNDTTSWTRTERSHDTITVTATGEFASAVGLDPSGALSITATDTELEHLTTGFVDSLGQSEPVIVGQTPYGVEALIACLISAAVAANHADTATPPDAVGLVHPDGMDEFRLSLLREAAKIAGLPAEHTIVMSRSDARAHASDDTTDAGAATAAWANVPAAPAAGTAGTATAAGAGAATAAGVTAAAVHLNTASTAAAAGTTTGPTGTPLGSTTGPTGTPIGPAGTTTTTAARVRPRWFPAAVAGGAAAAVITVVAVVAVATGGNDTPPDAAVATTITTDQPAENQPANPATTTPATTDTTPGTTPATTTAPTAFDTSAVIGTWESVCEPFIALDGASNGRYDISDAGPNEITMVIQGVDFESPDCSDAGTVMISQEYVLAVVADTTLNGRRALQVTGPIGPAFLAVDGDQMLLASGEDAASASDVIELVRI